MRANSKERCLKLGFYNWQKNCGGRNSQKCKPSKQRGMLISKYSKEGRDHSKRNEGITSNSIIERSCVYFLNEGTIFSEEYESVGYAEAFVEKHFAAPTALQRSSNGIGIVTKELHRSSSSSQRERSLNWIQIPATGQNTTTFVEMPPIESQRTGNSSKHQQSHFVLR